MIELTTRQKVIIVVVALATSFASGRWLAPEKVRIETKTVEVEKKTQQVDTNMDKHKEVVVTEVVKPDGTKETTTKTVEDTKAKTDTKQVVLDDKTSDTTKEISRSSSKVTINAIAAVNFSDFTKPPAYGLSVSRPILGPVTVQVFGLSNLTFGGGIGLTF